MRAGLALLLVSVLIVAASAKTHFSESFDDSWSDRWVQSKDKGSDAGNWVHTAGEFAADENDKGIQTGTDYRFYQLSSVFDEFSNEGEDLVFQFSIKHEQRIDCGGGSSNSFQLELIKKTSMEILLTISCLVLIFAVLPEEFTSFLTTMAKTI
jgi:hypothetical protein